MKNCLMITLLSHRSGNVVTNNIWDTNNCNNNHAKAQPYTIMHHRYNVIKPENAFKHLKYTLQVELQISKKPQDFYLPACQCAIRPGCVRSRAPEILQKKGDHGGFMKLLFRLRFFHCAMVIFLSSFITFLSTYIICIRKCKHHKER